MIVEGTHDEKLMSWKMTLRKSENATLNDKEKKHVE